MDEELKKRFELQDELLKKIYVSAEKTRKYFLTTTVITIVTLVIPLIILIFILPKFINTYMSSFGIF